MDRLSMSEEMENKISIEEVVLVFIFIVRNYGYICFNSKKMNM